MKDARTGEPTGALVESAMDLVDAVGPQPTRDEKLQAIRDAIALAHTFGVTSVQNASGTAEDFGLYDTLRRNGELELRVYQALSGTSSLTAADLDGFDAVRKQFPDDPLLKAGAVKLFVDGVVESQTAAMLAPYATSKIAGTPAFTPEQLTRIVTSLDARGWQVFAHAIGDRAIRMTLDAYQHAAQVNPASDRGRRHRIEHIETLDPADLPRFASIGVVASMQPDHGDPAPDLITVWKTTLGDERASRGWMYGSLLGAGAHVAFGSDWPVVSLDPRFGLHVATTRTSPNGEPEGGWIPNEKISLADALRAYTAGGAWASFDEQRKGTLKPGMLADVVILSAALFGPDAAKVLDTQVAVTIFDGRVVFDRAAKPQTRLATGVPVARGFVCLRNSICSGTRIPSAPRPLSTRPPRRSRPSIARPRDLARRIPARVRFGTSSWSFPGWKGLVYSRGATETSLAREGLREYAAASAAPHRRHRSQLLRAHSRRGSPTLRLAAARGLSGVRESACAGDVGGAAGSRRRREPGVHVGAAADR